MSPTATRDHITRAIVGLVSPVATAVHRECLIHRVASPRATPDHKTRVHSPVSGARAVYARAVLDIHVLPPKKTEDTYAFECVICPRHSRSQRWFRRSGAGHAARTRIRFGYRATDFAIPHHRIWDGFYPLLLLIRNGGPLFDQEDASARIQFDYPISRAVRDVFTSRAADLGVDIEVDAPLADMQFDDPAEGHVLAFGGGKDSRLILGLLRESGIEPTVVSGKGAFASDIPGALVADPIMPILVDRIMPSLMQRGRHIYYGGGLGETHRTTPWHRYYDMASARGRGQLSGLLQELGSDTSIDAPVVVLPYNLSQRMLHDRFADLQAGQISTKEGARTDKNLQVALLKLYHDIPHTDRIDDDLFGELLVDFVRRQLADPSDFGERDHREVINREMRSIIWRRRDHRALAAVRDDVPAAWDEAWIDYVHDYADPGVDPAFTDVFAQYAPTVDAAGPGVVVRRFDV